MACIKYTAQIDDLMREKYYLIRRSPVNSFPNLYILIKMRSVFLVHKTKTEYQFTAGWLLLVVCQLY